MKNLLKYCTTFSVNKNDATAIKPIQRNPANCKSSSMHSLSAVFFTVLILLLSASCDRNVASGCGTWPMVSSKNDRVHNSMYKNDVRPANYKNNRQYTYYKKYN